MATEDRYAFAIATLIPSSELGCCLMSNKCYWLLLLVPKYVVEMCWYGVLGILRSCDPRYPSLASSFPGNNQLSLL